MIVGALRDGNTDVCGAWSAFWATTAAENKAVTNFANFVENSNFLDQLPETRKTW